MKAYPPRRLGTERPVFGIDIDGTLGDYHGHFISFARGWLGRQSPPHPYDASVPMHKWLGCSKITYRQMKLAFRRGGLKRSMPCDVDAATLCRRLRERGALVIICTSRPFLSLENVEPDTVEWLRRNRIQYDGIISGEHKYRDLRTMYGADRIVGVLDDLPEMAEQARRCGLPAYLRSRPHNRHVEWPRVSDLEMARVVFLSRLNRWEKDR